MNTCRLELCRQAMGCRGHGNRSRGRRGARPVFPNAVPPSARAMWSIRSAIASRPSRRQLGAGHASAASIRCKFGNIMIINPATLGRPCEKDRPLHETTSRASRAGRPWNRAAVYATTVSAAPAPDVYRGSYTNVYGGAYYGYGAAAAGLSVGDAVARQQQRPTITRSPIIKLLVDRHTRPIRPTAHTRTEPTKITRAWPYWRSGGGAREGEGEMHATPVTTLLVGGARGMRSSTRGGASPSHSLRGKLWPGSGAFRQSNALR